MADKEARLTQIREVAKAVRIAITDPQTYAAFDEDGKKLVQAATRASLIMDADDRFNINKRWGGKDEALETSIALTVDVTGGRIDHDNHQAERMMINTMKIQNDTESFARINGDGAYDGRFDMLANGHLKEDGNKLTKLTMETVEAPLLPEDEAYIKNMKAAYTREPEYSNEKGPRLYRHMTTLGEEAGITAPLINYDAIALETVKRAAAGEQLTATQMKGLGHEQYPETTARNTPEIEGDKDSRDQVKAIGQGAQAAERIAYENSYSYDSMERMAFARPAPANEIGIAVGTNLDNFTNDPKRNALMIIESAEQQYEGKTLIAMHAEVKAKGQDAERMAQIEKVNPGILNTSLITGELHHLIEEQAMGQYKGHPERARKYGRDVEMRQQSYAKTLDAVEKAFPAKPNTTPSLIQQMGAAQARGIG